MFEKIEWEEFRKTGLLWFVNTILHTFGLAIVVEYDDNGHIESVYPAKTKIRGFTTETNTVGYEQVTKYMQENASELLKAFEE